MNKKLIVIIVVGAVLISGAVLCGIFMLTSTFLKKEPLAVVLPPSVSAEKVQEENIVQVLLGPEGRTYLTFVNDASDNQNIEEMKTEWLDKVTDLYNESHPKKISFSDKQKAAFSKMDYFGVPLAQLGEFLDLADRQDGQDKMEKWLAGEDTNPNHIGGIPISKDSDESKPNEFQIWMMGISQINNGNISDKIKDGTAITIKADHKTSFDILQMVMDNLQAIHMNKFSLSTSLKESEEE